MDRMTVSVILPVRNRENLIDQCLGPLVKQIECIPGSEIIVVDNDSRDRTRHKVRGWPVTLLSETRRASSYLARNSGILASSGEILAFIDSDCVASPFWLEQGLAKFLDSEVGCVAGGIQALPGKSHLEKYLTDINYLIQEHSLSHPFLPYAKTANVFYRRQVFDKVGLFEEEWVSGGDADLCWRMQLETEFKMIFEPKASVFHQHRSDTKAWFHQNFTHAIGGTLLVKKYDSSPPRRTFRESYWRYIKLWNSLIQLIGWDKNEKENRGPKAWFQFVGILGDRLGSLLGSFRHRVWNL